MTIERKSPVNFSARPSRTERRHDWTVVLEYDGESSGSKLIDLSHCSRWDLQDSKISGLRLFGLAVPEEPLKCRFENGTLINRMSSSQVSIWRLSKGPLRPLEISACTETTDGQMLLALMGENTFSITEKLSSLNLTDPKLEPPFLIQGPFSHVPCQIVVMERNGMKGALLVACSRGYADDMVHAVLDAGKEFGLRPAGENAFHEAIRKWAPKSRSGGRGRKGK